MGMKGACLVTRRHSLLLDGLVGYTRISIDHGRAPQIPKTVTSLDGDRIDV